MGRPKKNTMENTINETKKMEKTEPYVSPSGLTDEEWLAREKEHIKKYVNDGEVAGEIAKRNLAKRETIEKHFRIYKK